MLLLWVLLLFLLVVLVIAIYLLRMYNVIAKSFIFGIEEFV